VITCQDTRHFEEYKLKTPTISRGALDGLISDDDFRLSVLNDYFAAQPVKLPKSARLYEACLQMIENSYWLPESRIPSEKDLSNLLPVGLATVQTALRRLASTGLIQRKRKAGSFVCEPAAIGRELAYFLFLTDDGKAYLPNSDIELNIFETREQGPWSDFLGHVPKYICIERTMDVGGEFRIFNKIFLGDAKFRPLLHFSKSEFTGLSFRILFQDKFGAPPLGTDRSVQFTRMNPDVAKKLDRPAGNPALQYEIRQFTVRQQPLFYMQTIIPENNRTLRISAPST